MRSLAASIAVALLSTVAMAEGVSAVEAEWIMQLAAGRMGAGAKGQATARGKPATAAAPKAATKQDALRDLEGMKGGPARLEAPSGVAAPTSAVRAYPLAEVIDRGRRLAARLGGEGVDVSASMVELDAVEKLAAAMAADAPVAERQALYFRARAAVRKMLLSDPLLDFDTILFAKRAPGQFTHMSDQYYGWWSRGGGGICLLENWKGDSPRVRCISEGLLPPGSFLRPDLSFDGKRVVFAYARYYPHVAGLADKHNKANVPEDAFYHLYEMGVDGKGLRRLTRGKYDNFDARYLPGGGLVFCSTRRGQFIQCGSESARATLASPAMPDVYVRCGGDARRPVPVYTLHTMDLPEGPFDPNKADMKAISAFEMFEWTPAVANDGRILYARWDYIDRHNMPFMKLWSTNPDGTSAQIVWGNYVRTPHCAFEARGVPGSSKIIFTGSAHHAVTGGPLYLLDPDVNPDTAAAAVKLTPEVCDPETQGWPRTYYTSPWPLSEDLLLTAWSPVPLQSGGGNGGWGTIANPANAQGLYVFDTLGILEPIYRDPNISSECLMPLRPRATPPVRAAASEAKTAPPSPAAGTVVLQNVYHGLGGVAEGTIKRLRIVAIPAKTQPWMNNPNLGATRDDPGKCVLGTAPVEADGSAHFLLPAGVNVFFQALDGRGAAVQTMRSATYMQSGRTLSCVGCHESREQAPPAQAVPLAVRRGPSKIVPGPEGSWPLRFETLVQPALEKHCVRCHQGGAGGKADAAAKLVLTAANSYGALTKYASRTGASLHGYVGGRYNASVSPAGEGPSLSCAVGKVVLGEKPHRDVKLDADATDRLLTWMDTYAQQRGSFSDVQEAELRRLREAWKGLLAQREPAAP